MIHVVVALGLPRWFWHPLGGLGYQFFSGIGSSISEWLTILLAIGVYVFHHNCHEHRCWRLSWHPDEQGHPVCKKHHPDHPSRGVWWAVKHFLTTGHRGDHDHPRHAKHPARRRRERHAG